MSEIPARTTTGRATFAMGELLRVSWEGYARSFAVLFFSHFLFSLISGSIGPLLLGPFWYGLSIQALKASRGEEVSFEQFFAGFSKFGPTFVWGILLSAVCGVAFVVLCIPVALMGYALFRPETQTLFSVAVSLGLGIALLPILIATVLYAPTMFFMSDQGMDLWPAMKASREMVQSNLRQWLRLWGALALLHMGGLLLCCVGVLVTTPWMAVALAEGYRREQAALSPPQVPL